jgi:large subunit ribosomal protein L19
MKQNKLIQEIEGEFLKKDIPAFRIGDTLCIHTRIIEGEKERIQMFTGTVIARRGSGLSETVALYRVSYGASMERVFLLHSPRIAKVEVTKCGKVRKSKLYYLRGTSGKASKVKEQIGGAVDEETATAEPAAT